MIEYSWLIDTGELTKYPLLQAGRPTHIWVIFPGASEPTGLFPGLQTVDKVWPAGVCSGLVPLIGVMEGYPGRPDGLRGRMICPVYPNIYVGGGFMPCPGR